MMEFVRTARNPWGENVLLGLAWDVLWLVVAAGVVFIVVHAAFAKKKEMAAGRSAAAGASLKAALPTRIVRHGRSARISHWILAAATFALLITAFVPILGLQFPWVTIHWISGLIFGAYILYHIVDTTVRLSWGRMWIGLREVGDAFVRTRDFFRRTEDPARRPGKWGTENKVFHHLTAVAGLGVLATGLLMMARVDTWFWEANPYFYEIADTTWGWVYVLHGVTAVAFVGLLMAHIYLAVRPDNFWITLSMIRGWITREDYLDHHSPQRWPVPGAPPAPGAVEPEEAETAGVGAGSPSHLEPPAGV